MVRLIVAEKGSQAKDISSALGAPLATSGTLPKGAQVAVVALSGHVLELQPPEKYDPKYKKWHLAHLPILPDPFQRAVSNAKYFDPVKALLKDPAVTEVINGCDPDREGELIFCEVMEQCKCTKPTKRLWLKELTPTGIKAAMSSLRPHSQQVGVEEAAKCRQESDWLVGMNITRAQSKLASSHGRTGVESVGRCQTPTLAMVVDREEQIRRFIPKPFWRLEAAFQTPAGRYQGRWFSPGGEGRERQDRFDAEENARKALGEIQGQVGVVLSVDQEDKHKGPEQFYDIGAIRKAASKRFKFSGDKTNDILQQLYLKGVMSYPRTDFRHLTESEAEELPAIIRAVGKNFPEYAPIVAEMEQKGLLGKTLGKRFVDGSKVGEHSALRPTMDGPKSALTDEERQVFDLVVRRVLAAFFPDRITATTKIITKVGGHHFETHGAVLKDEGWSRIDPARRGGAGKGKPEVDDEEDGEEAGGPLPPVQAGMEARVEDLQSIKKMTEPPKRLTEPDLEELMKTAGRFLSEEEAEGLPADFGIGTGATRADIIKTLIVRGYLEKKKQYLIPMERAFALMGDLPSELLRSPQLTAEWERRLGKIERGEDTRSSFMRDVRKMVSDLVNAYRGKFGQEELASDQAASEVVQESMGACPACPRGKLVRFKKRDNTGYFAKCDKKTCGTFVSVTSDGASLILREQPCRFCGKPAVTSSPFGDRCAACKKTQGTVAPVVCDKCGSEMAGLTYKDQFYVKCMDAGKTGCTRSWYTTDGTFSVRAERERPKVSTPCPACGSPVEAKFSANIKHYLACTKVKNPSCKVWWPTDEAYQKPRNGLCKKCKGPLRPTKEQGDVCVKCGAFKEEKKNP